MRRILLMFTALQVSAGDARPPLPPPERTVAEVEDPELKASIEDCVRRGVRWLKAQQEPSGAWPSIDIHAKNSVKTPHQEGLTALALLALLKCGVDAKDPAVVRGLAWLKQQNLAVSGGYGYGIGLLMLEAKSFPQKEALPGAAGGPGRPGRAEPEDLAWAAKLASQLIATQSKTGGWRYGGFVNDAEGGKPGLADVSATQFALMGLKAARRMGVPVKIEVFLRSADYLLDQQERDGRIVPRITARPADGSLEGAVPGYDDRVRGWPYMKDHSDPPNRKASGGTTCAGLAGILVCRSELMEDRTLKASERSRILARMEQSVFDGLAWLDAHWSVSRNPPDNANWELGYYLYALERVGIMANLRWIGPRHDWYVEGARIWTEGMTKVGDDSGYWAIGVGRPRIEGQETPYGLLFLRQAALRLNYPVGEALPDGKAAP